MVRFVAFIDKHIPKWALGSMTFLVMEHCPGGSLIDWIARMNASGRKTTADEATLIAAQLVSALSYCHEKNIVHLDIKPGNVFVMEDNIEV